LHSRKWIIVFVLLAIILCTWPVDAISVDGGGIQGTPPEVSVNLSRSIAESLYSFRFEDERGVWSAENEGQDIGIHIIPGGDAVFHHPNGTFRITFSGFGRNDVSLPSGSVRITGDGRQVSIDRPGCTEWYTNLEEGIEQGMTIGTRPGGTGPVRVCYNISGDLVPSLDGHTLVFSDHSGEILRYSGLASCDSSGRDLAAWMELRGTTLSWVIDDQDAEYPVFVDPLYFNPVFHQVKILSGSDKAHGDNFGYSVAIDGDIAVVGAPFADSGGVNRGKVYVFYRDVGGLENWGEVKILTATSETNYAYFGNSVAVGNDIIAVGAPNASVSGITTGRAYIFEKNEGGADNWGQVKSIRTSSWAPGDQIGDSVAVSSTGSMVVIGAPNGNSIGSNRGCVQVFYRDEGGADNWGPVRYITASDAADDDHFGASVGIYGNFLAVGAPHQDTWGTDAGLVYIYYKNNGGVDNWGENQILHTSDAEDEAWYGNSVSITDSRLVVGADGADTQRGHAYVYWREVSGIFRVEEILTASDAATGDQFGNSVSVSGSNVVVGAPCANSGGNNRGQVYLFNYQYGGGGNWGQVKLFTASDKANGAYYGWSVAIDDATLLVGSHLAGSGGVYPGQAYVLIEPPTQAGVFRNGFWILDYNGNFQWDGTSVDKVAGFGRTGDTPVIGDWDTSTFGNKIGVFRAGTWLLDYNGNYAWDASDITASLGTTGDLPVVGDWDNDGQDNIGVFRNGFWILDIDGDFNWDGTPTDIVAGFGTTGDIPAVGDWNNDGQDNIGVFRNGFWILDIDGDFNWDGTPTDIVAGFGTTGDIPVPRDWDGDQIPEIGVFRPSSGKWIIDYNGNFAWDGTGAGQDVEAYLGESGDVAVTGDWNLGIRDKIGVYRDGFWIIDRNGNRVWDGPPDDIVAGFGMSGDTPVPGKYT
jgi:hypothetical protein